MIELQAAEARQRFTVVSRPDSSSELRDRLAERSERREQVETERIERVVSLVTHDGCQVNALVAYFGEERDEPCGHCSFCLSQTAQALPAAELLPEIGSLVDERALVRVAGGIPGCTRRAEAGRSVSLRVEQPRDEPGKADSRSALRRARRASFRDRARLVRVTRQVA